MPKNAFVEKKAQRLSIYLGESDRWRGRLLYMAILETLKEQGLAGATVLRGVAGFGAHSRIHTAAILRLSEDLPIVIDVIDAPEKITQALEVITPMVSEGMIVLSEVQVVKYTHRYLNPLPADKAMSDSMRKDVITVTAEMPIAKAWELMLDHMVKAIPVVDERGIVIGMLTDEDLLNRGGLQQRLSVAERLNEDILRKELDSLQESELLVKDIMTQPVITAVEDEPLAAAAARMAKEEIKRLPVVDREGKLVGLISRVDILRQVMDIHASMRKIHIPPVAARTLAEIMSAQIPAVHMDADLANIIDAFLESDSRRLIVLDDEGKAIGLISDADAVSRVQPYQSPGILQALRQRGPAPSSQVTAKELMSEGVLAAPPETLLVDAVKQMLATKRKWMVVIDEENRPIGLVDRQILLRALTVS